ncbi:MAG: hypothetical protein ACP5FH_07465, partial [Terracidiphilus sp.]
RLERKLLTTPATGPRQGLLAPAPEPVEQNLLVDSCVEHKRLGTCAAPDQALDSNVRFGQSYEYRAQRVERIPVDGTTLDLAGPLSAPLRVELRDVFPPTVPTGLVAVATAATPDSGPAIDLSWRPVSDPGLAGYAVYRRENGSAWRRISPAEPLVPPAFHDAGVLPGHAYHYAVSSIGRNGHESARSAEAGETVPSP